MNFDLPRARQDLIVTEVDDEFLVYDELTKKAFCLNDSSAIVWKMCDGQTPIATMIERASKILGFEVDDSFVLFALEQLQADGLLERGFEGATTGTPITRAQLMRRLSRAGVAAAVAIPLVAAVAAPTAAKAYGSPPPRDGEPVREGGHV